MSEKKVNVIEEINRKLLNMNEQEKSYLMGFLEGFAAMAGVGDAGRQSREAHAISIYNHAIVNKGGR